jgi:hypothetical protein
VKRWTSHRFPVPLIDPEKKQRQDQKSLSK